MGGGYIVYKLIMYSDSNYRYQSTYSVLIWVNNSTKKLKYFYEKDWKLCTCQWNANRVHLIKLFQVFQNNNWVLNTIYCTDKMWVVAPREIYDQLFPTVGWARIDSDFEIINQSEKESVSTNFLLAYVLVSYIKEYSRYTINWLK